MADIAASEADPFPVPQRRSPGGSIRWAVGSRDGARTQSWSVFGNANYTDVYIGPRAQTKAIKLSLHQSGRWRMAWTAQYAASIGMPLGENRVLARWEPPTELAPGWQHAVSVFVTRDSLTTHLDETGLGKVAFYPPPDPGDVARFMLLLGAPDGAALEVTDAIDVGSLELPGGGLIGVMMDCQPLASGTAAKMKAIREQMLRTVTEAGARGNRAFAWGHLDGGTVLLVDPGAIEPKGPAPEGGKCGAPGRLTYVRRVDPAL